MKYVTAKDIVIPAGTPVQIETERTSRYIDHASIVVGPTKDTHFEWIMAREDAIEAGLIVPLMKVV